MRPVLSLLLVVGLAGSLAACSSGSSDDTSTPKAVSSSTSCDATPTGKESDAVKAGTDFGTAPAATFTSPVSVDATQRTVVSKGGGAQVVPGDTITAAFSIYSGTTGKELSSVGFDTSAVVTFKDDEATYLPGLVKIINCSTIGSRVVGVVPPADAWGEAGQTDIGVGATDSVVFVLDIISKQADHATGKAVAPKDGFPTVVLADSGEPTITVPKTTAPTKTEIEVLKKGDGAVVADGDTVSGEYAGVIWDTNAVFDSSWATPGPISLSTDGVIEGFKQALVGQTVGSQVLVVVPPADGYGTTGSSDGSIKGTDTLVFVIDILGLA